MKSRNLLCSRRKVQTGVTSYITVKFQMRRQNRLILVALLHGVSVVDLEMERAVIKSVNVAFDVDPLPCMDILPSLKGQC